MGIRFTLDLIQSLNPGKAIQEEVYRPVVGYENLYEVSNWGNVRSLDRLVSTVRSNGRSYTQLCRGKQLSISNLNRDYLSVWLEVNPKPRNCTVHRLVAQAFLQNPSNKRTVNHIDGNKQNPYVENLEWASYSQNRIHAIQTGLSIPNVINMIKSSTESVKKPVKILETGDKFESSKACDKFLGKPDGFTDSIISRVHDGYCSTLNIHIKRISKEEFAESESNKEEVDKVSTINRGLLHASKCVKVIETGICFNSMTACDKFHNFAEGATGDCINNHQGYFAKAGLHFENISKAEYLKYIEDAYLQ